MRIEIIVFGVILLFVAVLTVTNSVPGGEINMSVEKSSLPVLGNAAELQGISNWINTEPFKISDLKGKVVLVDFWTYSCINCIRTLPHLVEWYDKYADKGLVIVGVHTPEFEFEKDPANVEAAVRKFGIEYPVVQDNNFDTWKAYDNRYWPREYLIDKDGQIRHDHIGEGSYDETEKAIVDLLREIAPVEENFSTMKPDNILVGTPEIYLGYSFARTPLGNSEGFSENNVVDYKPVNATIPNIVYFSGKWHNGPEIVRAVVNSRLFLIYSAKNVNIVAGNTSKIRVFVDGKPSVGDDVVNGTVSISDQRLYNIVKGDNAGTHLVEIDADPGFELYTFTFG